MSLTSCRFDFPSNKPRNIIFSPSYATRKTGVGKKLMRATAPFQIGTSSAGWKLTRVFSHSFLQRPHNWDSTRRYSSDGNSVPPLSVTIFFLLSVQFSSLLRSSREFTAIANGDLKRFPRSAQHNLPSSYSRSDFLTPLTRGVPGEHIRGER